MKYCFPKKLRLNCNEQFKQAFKGKSQKISTKVCGFFFFANNIDYSRIGIVVPKKNIHGAVQRNFFKRVLRENFRLRQHQLNHYDIVVYIYKSAAAMTKSEILNCLEEQWEELIRY